MTMRKALIPTLFVLFAIIINSCGEHRYPSSLVMADSLCDTNPDSALSLLSSIGKDSMQMTETDLIWTGLKSMKNDKNLQK